MLKKKYSLQSPKIFLEKLKSPLIRKRIINTKNNSLYIKPATLSNTHKIVQPFVFKKNKSPIKTISFINNDTGKMRHFTPAAQEWYNSIYSYNNNYIKLLPSADKNVMKLLKSYFNLFVNNKILKTKRIANRYRKLSANKVFVGKGELKHTNNKVIITSYVYNVEQLYLKSLVRKEAKSLYYPNKELKRDINIDRNKKDIIKYNRPFTLREYLNIDNKPILPNHPKLHKELCFRLFWKQYIKLIGIKKLKNEEKKNKEKEKKFEKKYGGKEEANILLEFVKFKMIYLDPITGNNTITSAIIKNLISSTINNNTVIAIKNIDFNEFKLKDQIEIIFLRDFYNVNNDITYQNFINPLLELVENKKEEKLIEFKQQVFKIRKFFGSLDVYMAMAENNYLRKFYRFSYLLMINTVKFKTPFVSKLLYFLKNVYKKNVELNIVNLNKMHLSSDIYTQVVSLKLKNRDNKLFRVLRWSLNKVKLPNVSRMTERLNISNRDDYLINKIRNTYINSMFNNVDADPLNNLLLRFFSRIDNLEINIKKRLSIIKRPISLYKYIIRSLKHIKLAGIRVEAKGRLTRRFTASRSVFKMRWKGGLKNVDSSFKGLSAIMLRGDRKSNVEYSMLSSKNRNGAYGVKGWVSSK
jgi:Mitochondrial ribosomal protein (VAR1)